MKPCGRSVLDILRLRHNEERSPLHLIEYPVNIQTDHSEYENIQSTQQPY